MKRIWICLVSVATVTGNFVAMSRAELVATYDSLSAGGTVHVFESVTARTYVSEVFDATEGLGTLFEDIVVFDGETRVDVISEGVDDDFSAYENALTDGDDWWLYDGFYYIGGSRVTFQLESVRLHFSNPEHSMPILRDTTYST